MVKQSTFFQLKHYYEEQDDYRNHMAWVAAGKPKDMPHIKSDATERFN